MQVLRGLAFALPGRAFTALIGPSGCGKTTTLRILMGLDRDWEGAIDPAFATARLAAAFQEPRLLPWRTVAQNVALALNDAPRGAVEEAISAVGLDGLGDRFPSQLSLGQQRRAALARVFAVRPEVLFLDEPFVSLDEATAQRLRGLLIDLWRRDPVTVLMVTHNVSRGRAARGPHRAPVRATGPRGGRGGGRPSPRRPLAGGGDGLRGGPRRALPRPRRDLSGRAARGWRRGPQAPSIVRRGAIGASLRPPARSGSRTKRPRVSRPSTARRPATKPR